MADSYPREMPKARINITLNIETEGAKKNKELPLKLLVLGDFSCQKQSIPLTHRKRINVNKENFNQVMKEIAPECHLTVKNLMGTRDAMLPVDMQFNSFSDFHPERIVAKLPELSKLLTMRNLLRDLKANLIDNRTLRRILEAMLIDKQRLQKLQAELKLLVQTSKEEQDGQ